jgi:hypothetical protein
MSWEY